MVKESSRCNKYRHFHCTIVQEKWLGFKVTEAKDIKFDFNLLIFTLYLYKH